MKNKKNFAKVAKREKLFSTLAKKEGKSNAKLAKKAKGPNKKDLEWEAKIDAKFAKIRSKRSRLAKSKSKD